MASLSLLALVPASVYFVSLDALLYDFLSAGMIYWGQEAYRSLDALHGEMQDPDMVATMFNKFDNNHDGCELVISSRGIVVAYDCAVPLL